MFIFQATYQTPPPPPAPSGGLLERHYSSPADYEDPHVQHYAANASPYGTLVIGNYRVEPPPYLLSPPGSYLHHYADCIYPEFAPQPQDYRYNEGSRTPLTGRATQRLSQAGHRRTPSNVSNTSSATNNSAGEFTTNFHSKFCVYSALNVISVL